MLLHESVSTLLPSSHCSPCSTTPLRHTGAQSLSVLLLAPVGQQPSPFIGSVIGVLVHIAWHVPPATSESAVHDIMSLHVVGHAPTPVAMPVSQSSPDSRTPLPHATAQSLSVVLFAPLGQQPSPFA